jgi:hypothetical protein
LEIINPEKLPIDFGFAEFRCTPVLRLPDHGGSEEAGQTLIFSASSITPTPRGAKKRVQTLIFSASSITPSPRGAKKRVRLCWRVRRSQNQFTPPGTVVNKLIFEHYLILYVLLSTVI